MTPAPAQGYVEYVAQLSGDRSVARDFLRRWDEAGERGRKRLGATVPLADLHHAALHDPDPWLRRQCLTFLDHGANDESSQVFLAALADPVGPVREIALHGLACERCRSEELCVADVVPVVAGVAESDPSPEVRHKALVVLARLAGRSAEARAAIDRAAANDDDPLVRLAAAIASTSSSAHVPSRARLLRRASSRRGRLASGRAVRRGRR